MAVMEERDGHYRAANGWWMSEKGILAESSEAMACRNQDGSLDLWNKRSGAKGKSLHDARCTMRREEEATRKGGNEGEVDPLLRLEFRDDEMQGPCGEIEMVLLDHL